MASEQHLTILAEGADSWNDWRVRHPEIRPDLNSANLEGRSLINVQMDYADLGVANLRGTNCQDALFHGTHLAGADFSNADLRRARFPGAFLLATDFTDADLSEANLTLAVLYQVRMDGANLSGAIFGHTMIGCTDLGLVRNIEEAQFVAPSAVSIDTLYASDGDIPLEFLAGTGVPRDFLRFFGVSVLSQWQRFPSCFISYSNDDKEFVNRIYRSLRRRGIQCWYAPEDLGPGDKIRPSLDRAIHTHGKMLLVLSRSSINSQWVEQEVESALANERKYDRSILFPVRLDDEIESIEHGWPALIKNTRHIADFRGWRKRSDYEKALRRLIDKLEDSGGVTGTPPIVDFRTGGESFWGDWEKSHSEI